MKRYKLAISILCMGLVTATIMTGRVINNQVEALDDIRQKNTETLDKIINDKLIAEKIGVELDNKQVQIANVLKSGDIDSLKQSAEQIRVELSSVSIELSNIRSEYEAKVISDAEMKNRLSSADSKLSELDAKYSVLQVAISTLEGSIDERITAQLGDIELLKAEIKQQVIDGLNSSQP